MKIFFFLLIIFILFSCEQNQTNKIEKGNGKVVVATTGDSMAEKNLKFQLKEYMIAYNEGDPDKAMYYIYPDIFVYLSKHDTTGAIDLQEIKDSFFIEPIRKIKKIVKEKNIHYEFEIGNFTKKVNYKNSKLYMVITYLNGLSSNIHSIFFKCHI